MNSCVFVGRIGRDAETRQVGDTTVTSFSLASDVGYGDKKQTLWLDCSIWGNRGQTLETALVKGSEITVVGELSEREYNNKDGELKKSLSMRVNSNSYPKGKQTEADAAPRQTAAVDDDIPF